MVLLSAPLLVFLIFYLLYWPPLHPELTFRKYYPQHVQQYIEVFLVPQKEEIISFPTLCVILHSLTLNFISPYFELCAERGSASNFRQLQVKLL